MFTHANCSTDFAINLTKCDCVGRGRGLSFIQKKRGVEGVAHMQFELFIFLFICKINYKYYVLDYLLLTSRLQIVERLIMELEGLDIYGEE